MKFTNLKDSCSFFQCSRLDDKVLIYRLVLSLYSLFFIVSACLSYEGASYPLIIVGEMLSAITFMGLIYLSLRRFNFKYLIGLSFLASMMLALGLRGANLLYFENIYGTIEGLDTYTIKHNVQDFIARGRGLLDFKHMVGDIDDWGIHFLYYVSMLLSGRMARTELLVLVINLFCFSTSAYWLYKLCRNLSFSEGSSRMATAVYLAFPYMSINASRGLKEAFFSSLIVGAIYCMYAFKKQKHWSYALLSLFFIVLSYFFRIAVAVLLLIAFFALLISQEKYKKFLLRLGLTGFALCIVALPIIVSSLTKFEISDVLALSQERIQRTAPNLSLAWLLQGVLAFFGPFPNFSFFRYNNLLYNVGLLLKVILSGFVVYGLWDILRGYKQRYYALACYFLSSTAMLILIGQGFDFRFHLTIFPVFCVLFAYALDHCSFRLKGNYAYLCIVLSLVILYNFR